MRLLVGSRGVRAPEVRAANVPVTELRVPAAGSPLGADSGAVQPGSPGGDRVIAQAGTDLDIRTNRADSVAGAARCG